MRKNSAENSLSARGERKGFLEERLPLKAREWIEAMVNEEFEAALGGGRHERSGQRRAYARPREEMEPAPSRCGEVAAGSRRRVAGVYEVPGESVEDAANDEQH